MNPSYPDSVRFLYALGNEYHTIKLGLERITTLLDHVGSPQDAFRVIHVAGTNGKGSTCALIESALRRAGVATGLYTSPHLSEPTERVQITGVPVSPDEFTAAFDQVHTAAESLIAAGQIDAHPTYFETMTAMALLLFRARRIDTAVLEVGMGGRLDATNIVTPALSVITPIDFDHEQFLGGTIPKIAFEKAGIIKPGRPVVFSRQRPDALPVLREKAAREHAPIIDSASWRAEDLDIHPYGSIFRAVGPHAFEIECPLIGEHQVDNALTAIAALDHLGLGPAEIHDGIAHTRWPGRLERVRRHPDIFLDGAHNPAGAAALARYLETFQRGRTIWMIFAAMRDKDVHLIGERIFPLASHLIFTTANQTRAFSAHELRELSGFPAARTTGSIREALDLTSAASPEDLIIVTGSLYLVGEARAILVS